MCIFQHWNLINDQPQRNVQKNLKYKWLFNSTIDSLIELPLYTNDADLQYSLQHEHQPQHIDAPLSSYKTKNNYNSIELQHPPQRSNQHMHSKKYLQQGHSNIHYNQNLIDGNHPNSNHHHSAGSQGSYYYKIENFTSFGTISCSAENQYGTSGPCLYHIMVAGKFTCSQ